MDRLGVMNTFMNVVRQKSFTKAAKSVGISRALASRHIKELEDHLGVRLVNRTTRSVSLTESGKSYYELCCRIMSEINSGEDRIVNQWNNAEGTLSVIAPKWIGTYALSDAALAFAQAYPKILLELELGGLNRRSSDFLDRGFDLALQTKILPDSTSRVRKLGDIPYTLVASPDFVQQHGPIETHAQLAELPCAVHPYEPNWRFDGDGGESLTIRAKPAFLSNTYLVLRKAALAGIGIANLPRSLVKEDLDNGSLIEPLADLPIPPKPLYAILAPKGPLPTKVRMFVDFLGDWFRDNPPE